MRLLRWISCLEVFERQVRCDARKAAVQEAVRSAEDRCADEDEKKGDIVSFILTDQQPVHLQRHAIRAG